MPMIQQIVEGTGPDGTLTPRLDIVAVHGLNPKGKTDHAMGTWTTRQNKLWLRDDLPSELPDVRVLIYEYDSKPVFSPSQQRMTWEADELLARLHIEREESPHRPLIFIAHSLGGILVKQALVNAQQSLKYQVIKASTRGLMFFATPHRGGNEPLVGFGGTCAKIVNTVTGSFKNDYMDAVTFGTVFSDTLRSHWNEQLTNYPIYSFYEGIGNIVSRDSATLGLGTAMEEVMKLDANHSNICKLDKNSDKAIDKSNYKVVMYGIRTLYNKALSENDLPNIVSPGQLQRRGTAESDKYLPIASPERSLQAIQVLRDSPMGSRPSVQVAFDILASYIHQVAKPSWALPSFVESFESYKYREALQDIEVFPGTCKWILNIKQVKSWARGNRSGLLWLHGPPGVGKSFLARHLVDELEAPPAWAQAEQSEVLYSFCHYQKNSTPSSVLSVLIHRLLYQIPELQERAFADDRAYPSTDRRRGHIAKSKHQSPPVLYDLLQDMVEHARRKKIFIIVDGVDVLSRKNQEMLMKLFERTFRRNPRAAKTPVKLLFTSRPCPIMREMQSLYETHHENRFEAVDADEYQTYIEQDLELFITQKLKHFRGIQHHEPEVLDMIEQKLKQSASKTFLQVSFYFRRLENEDSTMLPGSVLLDQASEDLAGFYKNPFQALLDQHLHSPLSAQKSTSMLLTLVAYSFKSLSIADLAIATRCTGDEWDANEMRPFTKDEERSAESSLGAIINGLGSPILKVDQKASVEFFHPSIRDSILRPDLRHSLVADAAKAHHLLAISCIRIIVRNQNPSIQSEEVEPSARQANKAFLETPFLRYAMQFWHKHLLAAIPPDTPTTDINSVILKTFNSLMYLWTQPTLKGYRAFMLSHIGKQQGSFEGENRMLSPIEILSDLGLDPFLRMYIKRLEVSQTLDSMQIAAENALLLAARGEHKGHEACFWTLLKAFNITSLEDDKFKTMISDSTQTQQHEILAKVLKLRTVTTDEFVEALLAAFISGDKDILDQLTQDPSIFTKVTNGFGMTPLHAIFVRNVDEDSSQPIQPSISHGRDRFKSTRRVRHAIAAYLLANGVKVDAVDHFGYTALHWACSNRAFCQVDTIKFLVQRGANPRAQSSIGLTALHLAAYFADSVEAVKLLIELSKAYEPQGPNIVVIDTVSKMTPLHWAVTRRQRDSGQYCDPTAYIVMTLLRHGGNLEAPNSRGITPLEWGGVDDWKQQDVFTSLQGIHITDIPYDTTHEIPLTIIAGPGWEDWTDLDAPRATEDTMATTAQGSLDEDTVSVETVLASPAAANPERYNRGFRARISVIFSLPARTERRQPAHRIGFRRLLRGFSQDTTEEESIV